jgi:hypothetical protein
MPLAVEDSDAALIYQHQTLNLLMIKRCAAAMQLAGINEARP